MTLKPCLTCGMPSKRTRCPAHEQERNRAAFGVKWRRLGRRWKRLRAAYLLRNPLCQAPGCDRLAVELDHIVPRSAGGSDVLSNLQGLCALCHQRKSQTDKELYP